jgi:23S rRNA (guanine745-N1)-methyltransferase
MMAPRLACTVDGCALPLERSGTAFACANGHSYDIARSGYVNLLQPNDRRSLDAGDSKDAVAARARLIEAHVGQAIVDGILQQVSELGLTPGAQVADLGCGPGHLLAGVEQQCLVTGIGIDLSAFAIDYAARRRPGLTWVVANADRRLPLLDKSMTLVLSMHARRNPAECARVLVRGGFLLVAVPAHDDLIELRASVQGAAAERHRVDALVAEHQPFFSVVTTKSVRERRRLGGDLLRDLLRSTYRGARQRLASQVEALEAMDVTLASEVVLFAPVNFPQKLSVPA